MTEAELRASKFWEKVLLQNMNTAQWEALCDGCGRCCLHKLQDADSDAIYHTNVACDQLDIQQCRCKNYANRFELGEDCVQLDQNNVADLGWLPETCAYRCLAEGKSLPDWHPLVTGSKQQMHAQGISVQNFAVYEIEVIDWEDHILNHPGRK